MSDYARIHDFSVKDGLTTGDPNKVIKGSEVDAELDALVTAVASKIDEPASPQDDDILLYSGGAWTAAGNNLIPAGVTVPFAGTTLPTGWLWCDGSSISTSTYADLFAAIGYTYGGSGGSFSLPDLRGRSVFGKDDMDNSVGTGGGDAARLTSGSAAGVDGDTLGDAGGVEEHQLTKAEMPLHGHPWFGSAKSGGDSSLGGLSTDSDSDTLRPEFTGTPSASVNEQIGGTGGDTAHTNVPPAIVLNYIIHI